MLKGPEAFCRSYDAAMRTKDGRQVAAHYLFPYYSFTLGAVHHFDDRATADAACTDQIARFEKAGFGSDIRIAHFKVEDVGPFSAVCHVTWAIRPKTGEGWKWTNIYGYRQRQEGGVTVEGFEFNISDNEIAALLERAPAFYQL